MTILISYDGSDNAESAISAAARLVARENASAVVLAVWEPLVVQALRAEKFGAPLLAVPNDAAGEDELSARAARQLAEHGVSVAAEAGFDARARWVADGRSIATTIIEEADELDADLIVMGSRGLTGISAFLGSVSNRVLQRAHRPVLVVPAGSADRSGDAVTAGAASTPAGD